MDIKDILAQLDSIDLQEAEDSEIAAQQQLNKEKVDYVKKQEHLYSLLKQLRDLVGTSQFEESRTSISKELVESFGYSYALEDQQLNEEINWSNLFFKLKQAKLGKFAVRFTVIYDIYQVYKQIKVLPESMPFSQKVDTVTNLISGLVKDQGLFFVGAWITAFVLAPLNLTGIGVFVEIFASIVGGLWAQWQFGDDVTKLSKWIVEQVFGESRIIEPSSSSPASADSLDQGAKELSRNPDPEVLKIQQALIAKGANIAADGRLGPETFKAFDQYGDSLEEASVAESIRYLQSRLAVIENSPNEVNDFNGEYAFNEEFSIEAGKKKFISKHPELAKKLGIMPEPSAPVQSEPAASTTPAVKEPVRSSPDITTGSAAKPVQPSQGAGIAPVSQLDSKVRLNAMSLVKQIQSAIRDMQNVPPSVQGDASKAIAHAQKTLQTYTPSMV